MAVTEKERGALYRVFFKVDEKQGPVREKTAPVAPAAAAAPAEKTARKWLTLSIRNDGAETVSEMSSFPFLIGREYFPGGLHIDNKSVSRRHALVAVENGEVTISDQNSSNGVEVSGRKLYAGETQPLRRGDIIKIGRVEVRVVDISETPGMEYGGEMTEYSGYTEFLLPKRTPGRPPAPASEPVQPRPPAQPASEPAQPAPEQAVFCTQCGHSNKLGQSNFCAKCGSILAKI